MITPITLTQVYGSPTSDATGPTGTVQIDLRESLTDSATGVVIARKSVLVYVVNGIMVPQIVEASDDPTTVPAGITYHFTERIIGAPTREWDAPVPHTAASGTCTLSSLYASP